MRELSLNSVLFRITVRQLDYLFLRKRLFTLMICSAHAGKAICFAEQWCKIVGAYAGGVFNPWLPQEMQVGQSKTSLTGEGEIALLPEDTKLEEKLQPVISCLNNVAAPLRQGIAGYSEDYPHLLEKAGSTRGPWRFKLKVYEQNNSISRDCIKDLGAAISMAPADAELDGPAKSFADTLEALIPLMNDADMYYRRNENVDDNMTKGKVLDSQLVPLFETFLIAADQLHCYG